MSAYIILIREKLLNVEAFQTYDRLARAASQGFEVRPLAFYGETEGLEHAETDGAVILQFSNMAEARRWYHSDAYQEAKKYRDLAGEYKVIMTEGLPTG